MLEAGVVAPHVRAFIEMGLPWGWSSLPEHVLSPRELALSIAPESRDSTRFISEAIGLSWSFPSHPLAQTRKLTEQLAHWLASDA